MYFSHFNAYGLVVKFLKDDQCSFHLIKNENRMKLAYNFKVSRDSLKIASKYIA